MKFFTDFMGYSLKFSPFHGSRLAVATSQHFGIMGNGRQFVLDVNPVNEIQCLRSYDTQDGLFDCAWSEQNENHLIAASGDGSIKLWDLTLPQEFPIRAFQEHTHEVYALDWNLVYKDTFLSGSYDTSIKWWSPARETSLQTFRGHQQCVYSTMWSPRIGDVFASVSGDCTLKIWATNDSKPKQNILAHSNEILTCDWNKYNEFIIATGSVDRTVKIWDIRNPRKELVGLSGHHYAVRRLRWSPHSETMLASVSYDMSTIVWDIARQDDPFVRRYENHTEFVVGIDFNLFVAGQMATCAWDSTVEVLQV